MVEMIKYDEGTKNINSNRKIIFKIWTYGVLCGLLMGFSVLSFVLGYGLISLILIFLSFGFHIGFKK